MLESLPAKMGVAEQVSWTEAMGLTGPIGAMVCHIDRREAGVKKTSGQAVDDLERTTRAVALILLLLFSAACEAGPKADANIAQAQNGGEISISVVDQVNLPLLDTVVVPTLDEETAWFQNHQSIFPSNRPDRLWAIDPINVVVTQFNLAGEATRTLDRRGQGPQELQKPRGVAEVGATLLVFDVGSPRVAAFAASGELEFEIPLQPPVSRIALIAEDEVAVVPGADRLVDIYSKDGVTRSLGPERGDSLSCGWCEIASLPEGRILVAEPGVPRLFLLDGKTGAWTAMDLRNDIMAEWQTTFAEDRRHETGGITLKNWISQVVEATDDGVFLLMSSPRPSVDGTELWRIDLRTGALIRYLLSGEFVVSLARQGDFLYGLLGGGRGVVKFSAPTQSP